MHLIVANGILYKRTPGSAVLTAVTTPTGVTLKSPRPCFTKVRKGSYIATIINGRYSPGTIWFDGLGAAYLLGITAPVSAPTIAAAAGTITGTNFGQISFLQLDSGNVVHESSLSPASTNLVLAGQGVQWTLPTTHSNSRVTHVRLYRSNNGDLPRRVADVALGTATFTETVSDAVRQADVTPPLVVGSDGGNVVDSTARNVPPFTLFAAFVNGRGWFAGDPLFPARLWRTRLGEPEGVSPDGWDDTPGGEAITGLGVLGNRLVVFTAFGMYGVEGFDEADISFQRIVPGFGCISHHGIDTLQNALVFPMQEGIGYYDGGLPRNIMHKSLREYWVADYAANTAAYENGIGKYHPNKGYYQYLVTKTVAPKSFSYIADCRQMLDEGAIEPRWALRILDRDDFALGVLHGTNERRGEMHYGAGDGYVRKDDPTDGTDDADTYLKKMVIRHKHFFYGDQGGDDAHGRQMEDLDVFMKHEANDVTIKVFGGDEEAYLAANPQWTQTMRAAAKVQAGRPLIAKTSTHFGDIGVNGKGHTVEYTILKPVGVEYRGLNIYHIEGEQIRPPT